MQIKITTAAQVSGLKIDCLIKRFPSNGDPEEVFDKQKTKLIDTFIIKSINQNTNMVGLVAAGASLQLYASPGDIARLFIHKDNLTEQQIWWL